MLETPLQVTMRIAVTSSTAFVCYFVIGMQLAVLPIFVHAQMGFSPLVAGLAVSAQYAATLITRPRAGIMSDTTGAKPTVTLGFILSIVSGGLLVASAVLGRLHFGWAIGAALAVLFVSRFVLGTGESLIATGQTLWGIGRVGHEHTGQVIAWSGVMSYSAVAAGAPIGVWIETNYGFLVLAIVMTAIPLAMLLFARTIPGVPVEKGEPHAFGHLLARVLPHGIALALASIGFGCIASFATLYYASRNWDHAALLLTVYGICFVVTRMIFAGSIPKFGGLRVVLVCLSIQTCGLLLLWRAGSPHVAMLAAAVSAAGFSLVFPSLGVEAVKTVSLVNRGSVLGIFTAFFDLALGVSGPAAGVIVSHAGYNAVFLFAAVMAMGALGISALLYRRGPGREDFVENI